MTSTITFVPGRTTGSKNVIHDGYKYCLDKKRVEKTYWKCTDKTLMGRTNPTIWRFIDVLKKEQDLTDWKIAQKLMRQPPPPRQKKWLDYDRGLNAFLALSVLATKLP